MALKTKTIKQAVEFKASQHEVFEALMDSKKHSQFTGGKAVISRKAGGEFTAYDGYAEGKNLELVKDKKIVQTWRASDWPEDANSKITFTLTKTAKGTKLVFTQEGVPAEKAAEIAQGWKDYYWKPLKELLEAD